MTVAFFDLDKTLISVNSANLWVREQWNQGQIPKRHLLQISYGLLRYSLGVSDLQKDFSRAISHMRGRPYASLEADAEKFYHSHIKHLYRPGALKELDKHRRQGDLCVILTTSMAPFARFVAKELEVDHCLSTELEVDKQGLCTGNTIGPICYGEGKRQLAEQWLQTQQIPLLACVFYTDSYTDMPMLNAVGCPVVVNPDPRLQRAAKQKEWPIMDWGVTTK